MTTWQCFWLGFSFAASVAAALVVVMTPRPMTEEAE